MRKLSNCPRIWGGETSWLTGQRLADWFVTPVLAVANIAARPVHSEYLFDGE